MSEELSAAAVSEKVEAGLMYRLQSGAPPHVLTGMGMASVWFGGGTVLAMRQDVT